MKHTIGIGRRSLGAVALSALLLVFVRPIPVTGQVTIADQVIARQKVVAGTTTASASPLTLGGLPGTGTLLRLGAGGSVGLDVLTTSDIPSVYTRRDVAETIPSNWTFSGGVLALTNATSNWITWPATGGGFPTVGTRSAGTRAVYFPAVGPTSFDYGMGIALNTIWWSVPSSGQRFAWFGGDNDSASEVDQDLVAELTGARDFLPGVGYAGNLGTATRKWLTLNAAELWVQTLIAQDTLATVGGRVLIGPTTTLTRDLAPGETTLWVKHNALQLAVAGVETGSKMVLESFAGGVAKFEVLNVLSEVGPAVGTGEYGYLVARNADGSGANQWYAGDAAFDTGKTGSGFIDLYSLRGLTNASQIGPTIVGNVRTGAGYNAWAPRWAIGNLQGLYGYATTTYGSAFGDPNVTWVAIDASNGFRVMNGATQLSQWDTAGLVTIGTASAAGSGRIRIGAGSFNIDYRGTDSVLRTVMTVDAALSSAGTVNINADTYLNATVYTRNITQQLAGNLAINVPGTNGHVEVNTTPSGTLRPVAARDGAIPLGDATHRWSNIHLSLPIQTGSVAPGAGWPYLVTGDATDTTRLGYFCGITSTLTYSVPTTQCTDGTLAMQFRCGVLINVAC